MSLLWSKEKNSASLTALLDAIGRPSRSASGTVVTDDSALSLPVVYACVSLVSAVMSSLPVDAVRRVGGVRVPVEPAPSLLREPASGMSWSQWMGQMVASYETRGNAYGMVVGTTAQGRIATEVEPIHPDLVSWRAKDGRLTPIVNGKPEDVWPRGRLFHVADLVFPGSRVGISRLGAARESIGHGLAAQEYGASFYEGGGHPSAILSVANDPGPDKARDIKERFLATRRSGEPSLLPSAITYTPIQVTPEDAEFLDAQRFSVEQIARFFRVPPEMVGAATSGQAVTYANVEQRGIDFLTYSIAPRLVRFEEALSRLIASPQVVKFNTAALLRTDLVSRYNAHAVGISNGFLTVDEVRELEDRPPLTPSEET